MKGTDYTEYRFEIRGVVKITVQGKVSDENFDKATEKAVEQVKKEIDEDWITRTDYEEYTDYEDGE